MKASKGAIRVAKIRVSWIHDMFKFEDSAPFSYTCSRTWRGDGVKFERIGSVLAHASQLSSSRMRQVWRMLNPNLKSSQIGIWCSGTKKCSRDTKSATFAKGIFQPFDLPKFFPNSVKKLSFFLLNVFYTYNTKLKLEKSSESEVGLFWVAPQISNFSVQA